MLNNFLKFILLFGVFFLLLLNSVYAANIEAVLDSNDGTSGFIIKSLNATRSVSIDSNSGIIALGGLGSGPSLNLDAGARLMWYPRRAAIRAGYVSDTRWNHDYIGNYSVGLGNSPSAEGSESVAMGYYTTASGPRCFAMGWNTRATANCDTALGASTMASGGYSTALGGRTTASAGNSVAMGDFFTNSTPYSLGIGRGAAATDPPDILMNPDGHTYINAQVGNVTVGTTVDAGSKLNVNGDVRLAARTAPSAAEGKIYFDSGTKRLNYCDGTQWIEVDPAYTTKEVKMAINNGGYLVSSETVANVPILTPTTDIIITNISFDIYGDFYGSRAFDITLVVNSLPRTTFHRSLRSTEGNTNSYETYDLVLPIPIKVSATQPIILSVMQKSPPSYFGSSTVRYASIQYIELPF